MRIVLMMVAVMVTSFTFAQKIKEKDVPAAVKESFQKQYPKATEVKWEKENGNYEVNFDLNEADYSVVLDEKGAILETEIEIEKSQLPAGALEYLKANYSGKKVKEAAKITGADGTVTYEAGIKGMDLIFDSGGKFIREAKE